MLLPVCFIAKFANYSADQPNSQKPFQNQPVKRQFTGNSASINSWPKYRSANNRHQNPTGMK
jgi:hypothetical protein